MEGQAMKYKVPSGMLEAARSAVIADSYMESVKVASTVCEAIIRHLSENPIVPTDDQVTVLGKVYASNQSGDDYHGSLRRTVTEWQRRMFLAEPEIPCEHINLAGGPIWDRKRNGVLLPDIPRGMDWCLDCGEDILSDTKPEIPEEIEDLMTKPYRVVQDQNADIIEAYRRGQRSKAK